MQEFYHAEQPPLSPLTRVCLTCGIEKDLSKDFAKHARSTLGYRVHCKDCLNKARREKRAQDLGVPALQIPTRKKFPPAKPGHKYCCACEKEKPLQEFHRKKDSLDGFQSQCKDCRNGLYRNYYADLPEEQRKETKRIRYANNREVNLSWIRKYHEKNRKRICQLQRKYRMNHPHVYREHACKRRALLKNVPINGEKINYQAIIEREGLICHICQQPIVPHAPYHAELVFDHVVPLTPRQGEPQGYHVESNLKLAHRVCNSRKNNRPLWALSEWDRRGPNA